jgi:calcium/calmodulin-dependent protein kinase I
MQAILAADYSFTPIEYWRNVSTTARDFINKCLTVDPRARMTAHSALQHPWVRGPDPKSPEEIKAANVEGSTAGNGTDLLPTVKKNFNARRTLHKAIDTVRAINKLREGGGLMHMDGGMSLDPKPKNERVDGSKVLDERGEPMEGVAQGGSGAVDHHTGQGAGLRGGGGGGDAMEIDSRGMGHGQTEDQIRRQENKIKETVSNLWDKSRGRS